MLSQTPGGLGRECKTRVLARHWNLANFSVTGNPTGEGARPTLWRKHNSQISGFGLKVFTIS
jgi:hypothetical protein